jgi:glutamate racemase
VAAPLLVPLIEGGFINAEETRRTLKEYLQPIIDNHCDTLILGCTHYPHVAPLIQEILGPSVTLVDPAGHAVEETKILLTKRNLLAPQRASKYTFLVTGSIVQFEELGSRLMNKPISGVKQINL